MPHLFPCAILVLQSRVCYLDFSIWTQVTQTERVVVGRNFPQCVTLCPSPFVSFVRDGAGQTLFLKSNMWQTPVTV